MNIELKDNGFTIVKLHYSDHPVKTAEWVESVRKSYPSEDMWNQEQELDFTKQVGRRAYPQFTREHITPLTFNSYKHIIRGWDFGYHHPAVIFCQINDKDQLIVLKEIIGTNKTLKEFAKDVMAVSKEHYNTYFDDYCDPSGRSKSDKNERTSVDILRTFGVHCHMRDSGVVEGLNLIRQMINKRDDGSFSMMVDPSCGNLIDGFFGGYVLKEDSEDPYKDGWYEHLFDALRYVCINVFDKRKFVPVRPSFPWARKRNVDSVSGY